MLDRTLTPWYGSMNYSTGPLKINKFNITYLPNKYKCTLHRSKSYLPSFDKRNISINSRSLYCYIQSIHSYAILDILFRPFGFLAPNDFYIIRL